MSAPPDPAPRAHSGRGERGRPRAYHRAANVCVRIIKYRELLVGMARKELKIKYKNSVLGFAWSLLNPLLYLVVFYIAFEKILGSGIPAFPIYLLSGLLVWNLFSTGLGAADRLGRRQRGLVKKVAFPREILPLAAVGSTLVHFFLQSMVLFAVLAVVRWHVAWAYVPLLPARAGRIAARHRRRSASCSRPTNVYLRDTQHFLELALLAWFWVTPIVYDFLLVGDANGLVHEGLDGEPGDADRARCSSARSTPSSTRTCTAADRLSCCRTGRTGATSRTSGMSFAFGIIVLALAVRVFGRSEANFAEEL